MFVPREALADRRASDPGSAVRALRPELLLGSSLALNAPLASIISLAETCKPPPAGNPCWYSRHAARVGHLRLSHLWLNVLTRG